MQFSDTTNKNGLVQRVEHLTGLGDGNVSGNATLLKIITANINQGYYKVASGLLTVDTNWKWDDSNHGNFPRATDTLVAGQKDYALPAATAGGHASTLTRVNKIAILDSASEEKILYPTDLSEAELNNIYDTNGLPTVYKLVANSVKIYPAPDAGVNVTLANGLIIYFERTFDEFTSADTTQQPGFPATFHEILAYYAAGIYLMPNDRQLATSYLALFQQGLDDLENQYSNRDQNRPNRIRPVYRDPR